MFRRSRRKIVAAIMSVLVLLWVGTLAVIYGSSYFEMSAQNRQMLKEHAEMHQLSQGFDPIPSGKPKPEGGRPGFADSPVFQLSTFYTVALSYDGQILEIRNDRTAVHSDEELSALAAEIAEDDNISGTEESLVYYKADKGGYILVAFMDNTIIHENAARLLRYTLIFGAVAMVAFFFLAVFLARKIVRPLEESHRKQKQFISDAGHELKTPVSVVSANAELLARQIGENQWLCNIQLENERMGRLVQQLLELAHTEKVSVQMERVDFSRLVGGEALAFESVAFEKGQALLCEIAPDIYVTGNSTQLRQVVSILLDNAICHSTGGQICLRLYKDHGAARLSVSNPGEEIPPEQREQIFERFYRMDTARTGEDQHYGLGLAIAKSAVDAHKGSIEVRYAEGLVEFRVALPLQ